jgi:hypothetical protein
MFALFRRSTIDDGRQHIVDRHRPSSKGVIMRFQSNDGKLFITPEPGYSSHIGVLVSTMQRCRETTILLVQDLSIAQLDYLFDEDDNSIGALLLHLAAIEAAYQEITFFDRNILDNPERLPKWQVPMELGAPARSEIRGHPASYYIEELTRMRAQTLEQMQQRDDSWLWVESEWGDDVFANNYWQWYHVYEDEINHRGEMSWRLSRMNLVP